jgi:hypothetical protein
MLIIKQPQTSLPSEVFSRSSEQKGKNMTKQEFLGMIVPLAVADMKKSKILASLTIAQAVLETGWGSSSVMMKAFALFGIKAGSTWKGRVFSSKTKEVYDGVNYTTITDTFRAYNSFAESVADHSALLTGAARYRNLIGEMDYREACRKIREDGYATAPNYTTSLIKVIEDNRLYQYDTAQPNNTESEETLMSREYEELNKKISNLSSLVTKLTDNSVIKYAWNDKNIPEYARETITKLTYRNILKGDENGKLNLSNDFIRMLVLLDRSGVFG